MGETIEILRAEYDALVEQVEWLDCLNAAGVDNWEGYDYARELWREMNQDGDE
jgi:hypothetical protein